MRREIKSLAELRQLQAMLARNNPQLAANVAAKVAPVLSSLAQASFDAGESVYGVPFGTGDDGAPIDLNASGTLRARAVRYLATGTRIRATVGSVRYARYHIRHGILPLQGKLPAHWGAAIRAAAIPEIERAVQL